MSKSQTGVLKIFQNEEKNGSRSSDKENDYRIAVAFKVYCS